MYINLQLITIMPKKEAFDINNYFNHLRSDSGRAAGLERVADDAFGNTGKIQLDPSDNDDGVQLGYGSTQESYNNQVAANQFNFQTIGIAIVCFLVAICTFIIFKNLKSKIK